MIKVAHRSETGKIRDRDEDSIVVLRINAVYESKKYERLLLVLGDGVGGSPSGETASYLATKMLAEYMLPELSSSVRDVDYSPSLKAGIKQANRSLLDYAARNPKHAGMCTTMVAAVLDDLRLYVGNVGDSRLYIINKRGVKQVTEDHVDMGGALQQAIGCLPEVEPSVFKADVGAEDIVLLCCDGLTDMVSDEEIRGKVLESRSLDEACDALVGMADERGGIDNISLILAGERDGCA
ncbi:MAG: serine/threonine-protein phosphatase [Candidatus Altiarchaeota archaeon]|nr:serine/threonine-protein phosphatase [Candidatus Altiarchaeota archaeon]